MKRLFQFLRALFSRGASRSRYRPELHYMRGPGPASGRQHPGRGE